MQESESLSSKYYAKQNIYQDAYRKEEKESRKEGKKMEWEA